ncbi:MAG: hypothetical protein ACREWE_14475 [Gammaproteobacteria bacterium]
MRNVSDDNRALVQRWTFTPWFTQKARRARQVLNYVQLVGCNFDLRCAALPMP